jgi:biopolymer transport protein ExbD
MAFGRLERSTRPAPMSDINMTPLIDVMLVLLVIFMLTAPLMSSSLKLDLPKAEAASASDTPDFLAVAINPQGLCRAHESRCPQKPPHRSAAACRQNRALWPRGRVD